MSYIADEVLITKGVQVGAGPHDDLVTQEAIGAGNNLLDGSVAVDGVVHVGDELFEKGEATVMIAKSRQQQGEYVVEIDGDVNIRMGKGSLVLSNLIGCTFQGLVGAGFVGTASVINVQGWKGFDIKHPSEEGYRLRHVCLEGPEGAIYTRGRIRNQTEIVLPDYWKHLVHTESITVQVTPIGSRQDIIVKRWDAEKIYLQSPMPIDCFYHVFGERKDGEKLIVEYEGETPQDYPGDNDQYSIAGYHYDRRTL